LIFPVVEKGRAFRRADRGWSIRASAPEGIRIADGCERVPSAAKQLAKKRKKQIPHRLKSIRDDKKGPVTARLKARPFALQGGNQGINRVK
jgi:hypothetical protein